jgi:hypothetical protein
MKRITKTMTTIGVATSIILIFMTAGCSGGKSPALPDKNQEFDPGAQAVLMSFADACMAQDLQAAGKLLYDPASDQPFLELIRDVLPLVGASLKNASAGAVESDYIVFDYQLSDPSDPSDPAGTIMPAFLYTVRTGDTWRVSFDSLPVKSDQPSDPSRETQWQTTTHWPILTNYIIDYYCSHYPADTEFVQMLSQSTSGFRTEVGLGSFTEDTDGILEGIDRTAPHMMAPKNQNTFPANPQAFASLTDHGINPGSVLPGLNILEWALGIGPVQTSKGPLTNEFTFPLAVQAYHDAQGLSGDQKTQALKDAFHKFGHVLHLIEDMTCPAHTRNDQHNFLTSDSDPFEDWASILNVPLMVQTPGLYAGKVAPLGAIPRDEVNGFPGNSLLQNFFDLAEDSSGDANALYRDYAGVSALFWYSCWMTNHLCYSEDTIYRSTVPASVDTTDFPKLTKYTGYGLDFIGMPGDSVLGSLKTLGIVPGSTTEYLVGTGTAKCYPWMLWYRIKYWKWPSIAAVAAAQESGQGLITVADIRDIALSGVREQQYKLQFPLCVLTGAALLHEYYLEAVGGV